MKKLSLSPTRHDSGQPIFFNLKPFLSGYVYPGLECQNFFQSPELTAGHLDRARGVFSIKVWARLVTAIAQVSGRVRLRFTLDSLEQYDSTSEEVTPENA